MSSPAVQLSFALRTSSNVKTVHLLGSWDNYKSQLPLSHDTGSNKSGAWKGTFRFPGSALKLGQRYWYYYIVDGYHVSHDPAKEYTTEPTTGRKLNILDMPGGKSASGGNKPKRYSQDVPTGRALSPGKIQHPKPQKPYASRTLREADYNQSPTDDLTSRFEGTHISDQYNYYSNGPPSSLGSGSALSSGSGGSSPSSLSSLSDGPFCHCERYGITRKGERVKIDCGGSRCGYNGSSSGCSEESSDSEEEYQRAKAAAAARRKGVVVRR